MNPSQIRFVYLADSSLHWMNGDDKKSFQSEFGRQYIERAVRSAQKNAWKTQGSGAQFMGMGGEPDLEEFSERVRIGAIAAHQDRLLYTVETGEVTALLSLDPKSGDEKRLFHSNETHIQGLAPRPDGGAVACSVRQKQGVVDLAMVDVERGGLQELTEGDSADAAPSWRRDRPSQLVYQSAGLARNSDGFVVDSGPSSIECLDIDRGTVETLAEEPGNDLLTPKVGAGGSLYYIRRKYRRRRGPGPFEVLKGILLFPFYFVMAIFNMVNALTSHISKKPMMDLGVQKRPQPKETVNILGELVELSAKGSGKKSDSEDQSWVPDWELVRRPAGGEPSVIAKGVMAFDVADDGVVYSNGNAVFHLDGNGKKTRLVKVRGARQVAVLD